MSAMNDDVRRILDLLAQGKISVDEAHRLIAAIGSPPDAAAPASGDAAAHTPRFMKIVMHRQADEHHPEKNVKARVPIAILRGGLRLGAIIPGISGDMQARLRERGVDLDLSKIDPLTI